MSKQADLQELKSGRLSEGFETNKNSIIIFELKKEKPE